MEKKAKIQVIFVSILLMIFCENMQYSAANSFYSLKIPESAVISGDVDYLIITTEEYADELTALAMWKVQKGLTCQIETVEQIELNYDGVDLAEKIKNCITDYHYDNLTEWVLLAGDEDDVPTRMARIYDNFTYVYDDDWVRCDSYYSDLDNNWDSNQDGIWGTELDDYDFHPEVYVGRLTANNELEMIDLVNRILNYEIDPYIGPWMTQALLAGAMICFDEDWDDNNETLEFAELDANRFHNFLKKWLPENWTTTLMGEEQGVKGSSYPYNISLTEDNLEQAINSGPSIGSITGHGNPLRMSRLLWTQDYDGDGLFDYTADPNLEGTEAIDIKEFIPLIDVETADLNPVNNQLGMYYLGGCSAGTFDVEFDSLAEYFLKTAAIGCIAGSNVVWGEDFWTERERDGNGTVGWYSEGLSVRFWEFFFKYNQPGKALALAKENYTLDRIESGVPPDYPVWEEKTLKQFNLLGDPEVSVWVNIPDVLSISDTDLTGEIQGDLNITVTADVLLVKDVIVTITDGVEIIWKGLTDSSGDIEIPLSSEDLGGSVLTVYKKGYIPFQHTFPNPNPNPSSISGYNTVIIIISIVGITFTYIIGRNNLRKRT